VATQHWIIYLLVEPRFCLLQNRDKYFIWEEDGVGVGGRGQQELSSICEKMSRGPAQE
jgi:hypothetical protein